MREFKKIYKLVKNWEPKKKYSSESNYQKDLKNYLNSKLNIGLEKTQKKTIDIKKQKEKNMCDIIVNGQVGIELKLTKKQKIPKEKIDRLFDEIIKKRETHKKGIIIVLVGKTTPETKNYLKKKTFEIGRLTRILSPFTQFLQTTYQVKFVDKGHY